MDDKFAYQHLLALQHNESMLIPWYNDYRALEYPHIEIVRISSYARHMQLLIKAFVTYLCFLSGLKESVRLGLRTHEPRVSLFKTTAGPFLRKAIQPTQLFIHTKSVNGYSGEILRAQAIASRPISDNTQLPET